MGESNDWVLSSLAECLKTVEHCLPLWGKINLSLNFLDSTKQLCEEKYTFFTVGKTMYIIWKYLRYCKTMKNIIWGRGYGGKGSVGVRNW